MPKRQPITVRLPAETYAKVAARAEAEHRSLANVVAAIVIDAWPEVAAQDWQSPLPGPTTQK
jgi:hypothetical protein